MATSCTQRPALQSNTSEYEIENFMEISRLNKFLSFDVEKLQRILESDNLNITREEDAYDAIKRWFNYDVSARQEALPLLVACLRLTQFDADFLRTHIQPLPGCKRLAFKAILWIREPAKRKKINMRFTEARATCEKTFLVVGQSGMNRKLLQYNKVDDKWLDYASLEFDYTLWGVILKDDNLLHIGGWKKGVTTNIVRSWNIRNKTWQNLPPMKQARHLHCVVELDGKIYAIGGLVGDKDPKDLSSVERYTTSDGWQFVKSLNVGRYNANAVALNGNIYIIGGWGDELLKSVECYNPDSDTWTSCPDMKEYHLVPAVAAHNGHIYVFGDNGNNKHTVERYNPQRKTWSNICPLNDEGGCKACVSIDNKLCAIDRNGVSVYDEENDRWEQKCSLPTIDIQSCFVVPVALLT